MAMRPRKSISPPTILACPAMGVLQFPSSAARNARSQSTQAFVSGWLSASMYFRDRSSSDLHWMPMAPWATAGSISSQSRTLVAHPSMSILLRPAMARRVASTTPSSSLRRRVWTLPLKFTHLKVGFLAMSCAWRRREAVPMTALSGRSAMDLTDPSPAMNASLVSSRGRLQGRTVPSGSHVGTSFIEWTHMSTSLLRREVSSSFVNRPLPPSSMRDLSRIMSPWVFMTQISMAPSSASSGKFSMSL
mmetsp:Transcript_6139/g.12734  ORF Transcript_6139/g.12734 Transcript_6139/m.12734 type:complete len:247 (+) Transcript_6139:246-986(+)